MTSGTNIEKGISLNPLLPTPLLKTKTWSALDSQGNKNSSKLTTDVQT